MLCHAACTIGPIVPRECFVERPELLDARVLLQSLRAESKADVDITLGHVVAVDEHFANLGILGTAYLI